MNEILILAANGLPLEAPAPAQLRAFYWTMRAVYQGFAQGRLDRETGIALRKEAVRQYRAEEAEAELNRKLIQSTTEFWKRLEGALNDYAGTRTLDCADRLWAAASGLSRECRPTARKE